MKAVFIADAHLKRATDNRYKQLINFLDDIKEGKVRFLIDPAQANKKVTVIDDLYIVGDLFDFWFCSKERIHPEFTLIINKLIELHRSGIRIHLSEGNHDFYMREYFHDVLGMEVHEEWTCVKMDNLQVMIAHGDTIDKTNTRYIFLRKLLRSSLFYHFQRFIPARIRWLLAGLSSKASKEMGVKDNDALVEKMLAFAVNKFQEDCDAVIIGHCHKPVLRHYIVTGKKKTFVALGDWINHYSFLYYEHGHFYLEYYRPH